MATIQIPKCDRTSFRRGKLLNLAKVALVIMPMVAAGARASLREAGASAASQAAAQSRQDNPSSTKSLSADDGSKRQKQLAEDSARLLKMAADLKAAVDKTDKDTLSLDVVRKAGAIEKLAHDIKNLSQG